MSKTGAAPKDVSVSRPPAREASSPAPTIRGGITPGAMMLPPSIEPGATVLDAPAVRGAALPTPASALFTVLDASTARGPTVLAPASALFVESDEAAVVCVAVGEVAGGLAVGAPMPRRGRGGTRGDRRRARRIRRRARPTRGARGARNQHPGRRTPLAMTKAASSSALSPASVGDGYNKTQPTSSLPCCSWWSPSWS